MSVSFKVDGFREIEKALAQLPASTAKGVARRAMRKELAPVARMANALYPGADDAVVKVAAKVARSQPQPKRARSLTTVFVGAAGTPHAHLVEWGTGPRSWENGKFTGSMPPQPFLQPAWDAVSGTLLEGLGARIWEEIAKTMARRAARG